MNVWDFLFVNTVNEKITEHYLTNENVSCSRLDGPKVTWALPFPTQMCRQVNCSESLCLTQTTRSIHTVYDQLVNCRYLNSFPEGFVSGVGEEGAYSAALNLDKSKVAFRQFLKN